ncbi:hypothetical protein QVD17_29767 [Tagetes erecta]|uniref:GTD-binding domain-containing protein n=1 Tax=Tagetes erecta TaxID=13708 RepID=A0AAD8K1K3_TARER|nr:hypothetical protein QVD17_29767 [Tagetes erecta]
MNSTTMAVPSSNNSLKEALCAQQKLLQKLYHELDVEREAAATAASEAMSMILRLQGEKAAVQMEAEQYKRLAEEKMNYAEESMVTFEEIMYQKEMEIASLDYQVQAYRYKLLSLGFDDLGVHEIKFPEYLLQRNESLVGETSSKVQTPPLTKRLTLPNLKKGFLEKDRSIAEDSEVIAKIVEESLREDEHNHEHSHEHNHEHNHEHSHDHNHEHSQNFDLGTRTDNCSTVDISSYLEQIRELDKVVEQMGGGDQYFFSTTAKTSRCSSVQSKMNEMDIVQSSQKLVDDKISSDTCSPSVCDVFEVPLIEETVCKDDGKSGFKDDGKSGFKDEVFKDNGKSIFKDEGKSVFKDEKKVKRLTSLPQLPIKSLYKGETDSWKKGLLSKHKDRKMFSLGDGINVDCQLALVQPNGEMEIVEQNVEHERDTSREERELRLLYEINEKLSSLQSEIRSRNIKVNHSSSNRDSDLPMLLLREATFDIWI